MSEAGRNLVDRYVMTLFVLDNCPAVDLPCCVALVETIYRRAVQAPVVSHGTSTASITDQVSDAP